MVIDSSGSKASVFFLWVYYCKSSVNIARACQERFCCYGQWFRSIVKMKSECLTEISPPYRTQYVSITKNEIPRNAHFYSIKKLSSSRKVPRLSRLVRNGLRSPDSRKSR